MAVRSRRTKKAGAKRVERFTAWSYSRLQTYEECPQKAKFQYIDKLDKSEPGPALKRGTEIHEAAEYYLRSKRAPKLHPDLELFADEFKELRRCKATPERGFQFDADWEALDDWFAKAVWVRIAIDALYTSKKNKAGVVIDFKTGKKRPWHADQLELYGLGMLIAHPDLKTVDAELWYTDAGEIDAITFTRDQVPSLIKKWNKRVKKMMADGRFEPKPSARACQWCPFKKAKGGPCEY